VSNLLTIGTGKSGGIAMFDRLIESDTVGAEFKSRRRYFLVSTIVVGALFVSAVVFSIYASEIGLGNDSYELTTLLIPVQPPADAPEPPQPQQQRRTNVENSSDVPIRIVRQQPIDVTPDTIPPVSTTPNKYLSIPKGIYEIGDRQTDGPTPAGPVSDGPRTGSSDPSSTEIRPGDTDKAVTTKSDPPPLVDKPKPPQSIGVVNGIAKSLPKPPYPAAAIAIGVQGKVDVQVTIDEQGNVISAKAASGHIMLRDAAVNAAWKAKFTPTLLSKVPVKVTGVIVYNFTRN
jgi:periplasmic protein TonB